ncbi:hypothetical protein BT96DRAFT_924866 [Gymnopus androsaceus JB14]|uniref:Fe2OG dioxygenase domain-containing protein n=1 Tax=Gymnopus androsaceus JB14 TaxID=1447944 RepID=A0A6A4H3A5_9AGAR|nr:hypothetical protein BT96DRAFT_924866 [Gymnopus androsaceus JB14]
MASTSESPNHPLYNVYASQRQANKFRRSLGGAMRISKSSRLALALASFATVPVTSLHLQYPWPKEITIKIGDVDAGTLSAPAQDIIMQHSTPSSFGRGEETVMDESYRRGREIVAANIHLGGPKLEEALSNISFRISQEMFSGRPITLKLYKLAVYESGGHFDWHRDSTHSDTHSATLLVFLNTAWRGGELKLRHGGKKVSFNTPLDAVAFFTDMEHKVTPITEGVRLVLQYDVDLVPGGVVEFEDGDESSDENDYTDEIDNHGELAFSENRVILESDRDGFRYNSSMYTKNRHTFRSRIGETVDASLAQQFQMLPNPGDTLAFSLHHLYRKASILPELLKGCDMELYGALKKSGYFEVRLYPIVLEHEWDGFDDGEPSHESNAYRADAAGMKDDWSDEDASASDSDTKSVTKKRSISDSGSDSDGDSDSKIVYHLADTSPLIEISSDVQTTGNEPLSGQQQYFGGGIFVTRLESESKRQRTE